MSLPADNYRVISPEDFAGYWGVAPDQLPEELREYLAGLDTGLRPAVKADLEDYLDVFLQKVTKPTARRSPEENAKIFEQGWAKHKARLQAGCDYQALRPGYYQDAPPYALGGDGQLYVCRDRLLPSEMQTLYLRFLALTFLAPYRAVHEFGSGSGFNLLALAETAPDKKIIGYEWTASGVELADQIGRRRALDVSGRHFDMLNPDYEVELAGQAALTVTAIEQLNDDCRAFMDFLLAKKPGLVIHIEPGASPDSTVYLRLVSLYLQMRGYSTRFSEYLQELSEAGKIQILFSGHLPWLGGLCRQVCTVWKPL